LEKVAKKEDVVVFHAGTKMEASNYFTAGGRVLNVCAAKENLTETMKTIYAAADEIYFESQHYRGDIGEDKGEN
ncbi:MAG: phosphoribosylamine--glycine ligase, partial [Candidatus Aminicenantes bacterium]|nr:phosphoribosylamine--glycine ligase [Candidatus Aminicenantes bacterium]